MSDRLWVAVPNGLGSPTTSASIRVLVVPRLAAGTVFTDFSRNWRADLDEATFTLETRTSAGTATADAQYLPRARSQSWQTFFGGAGGRINAWEPRSVPVPTVAETYTRATQVAGTYQRVTTRLAQPGADSDTVVHDELRQWSTPLATPPVDQGGAAAPPVIPDFHRTVAVLREHPIVMLDLGLIFELTVATRDLNVGDPAAARSLRVVCSDPPSLAVLIAAPWTRYDLDGRGFYPAPGPTTTGIRRGMLDLSGAAPIAPATTTGPAAADPAWAIATFDVDGAVAGLRQAASTLAQSTMSDPVAMPHIRSAGLTLVRPWRQTDFHNRAQAAATNAALSTMEDAELSADDLVLGYRVDIQKDHGKDGKWLSLCERDVAYTVNGVPFGATANGDVADGHQPEEGHVKPFTATQNADTGELATDEIVLRWDGWSMVMPKVNLRGDSPGAAPNPAIPMPYTFRWDARIPTDPQRLLPTLRFSHFYRMRVRIADASGGGVTRGQADIAPDDMASERVVYARHDPVPPPTLVSPGRPLATGAAVARLVIRSDDGMTVAQLSQAQPQYPTADKRALFPPTASLALIEQHGVFDQMSDADSWTLASAAMGTGDGAGLRDPIADGVSAYIPAAPGGLVTARHETHAWTPVWSDPDDASIALSEQLDQGDPITLHWNGKVLAVGLAQAKEATLEISSTLRGGFQGHLAMNDLLDTEHIDIGHTVDGRNPVVTPFRRVELVHAVRKPLSLPQWTLRPTQVVRQPGDTSVVLQPTFPSILPGVPGLNTDSTGRLDIAATWQEWGDTGPTATTGQRSVTVEHFFSETVDPGPAPQPQIRHDFGDTRHRIVSYTLNAVSRYRSYFDPSDPDAAFQRSHPQDDPVAIPSSARPVAPVVLAAGPALRWQSAQPSPQRIERTRTSFIRVELARPWYLTGQGEQLAVIVAPSTVGQPDGHAEFLTQLARDPLFATSSLPRFPDPTSFSETAGPSALFSVPELPGTTLGVVPYAVTPAGDRWCADIRLTAPQGVLSYTPFVQLTLARYQPNSLAGLELSTLVTTEKTPLMPDRHLVVELDTSHRIQVTLTGVGPNPPNRVEATLEHCDVPPSVAPESIDIVDLDTATPPVAPVWRPVPGRMAVGDTAATLPPISLPLPVATGRLRVRISEIENLPGVPDSTPTELNRRTLFVDTIVLPPTWLSS